MIKPTADMGLDELEAIGMVPGVPSLGPLGSVDGEPVYEHPQAVLRDDPLVADVWGRWALGCSEELPHDAWDGGSWSAWTVDAWRELRAAHAAKLDERMKRGVGGDG